MDGNTLDEEDKEEEEEGDDRTQKRIIEVVSDVTSCLFTQSC